MFGPFGRLVAFRNLRTSRQESFISVIAFFSLAGIMLGVATLIIVMSVMNGFRAEFVAKLLGFNGDMTAQALYTAGIPDFDALAAKAKAVPGVTRVMPLIESTVLASGPRSAQGAQVRGQR